MASTVCPYEIDSTYACLFTQVVSAWASMPILVPECNFSWLSTGLISESKDPISIELSRLALMKGDKFATLLHLFCCTFLMCLLVTTIQIINISIHMWLCPSHRSRPNAFPAFADLVLELERRLPSPFALSLGPELQLGVMGTPPFGTGGSCTN